MSRGDFGWGDFVRGDFVRGDFVLEPCRGLSQCPFFVFPTRWLWWGLNPQPSDYQADVLLPDHPAPIIKCLFLNSRPLFFRVFVDGTWHGEVKATSTANRSGFQYYLTDLSPGQAYDINVRVSQIPDRLSGRTWRRRS